MMVVAALISNTLFLRRTLLLKKNSLSVSLILTVTNDFTLQVR